MSDLIATLQAIVRHELARFHPPEFGIVTSVFSHDSESSENNHQVNVKLRSSGVELQRVPVAVGRMGISMLPNTGDLVTLVFIDGDINSAVVIGSVYDADRQPPVAQPLETVYEPAGDEDSAIRRFHLELPGGTALTVDDEKVTLISGGTEVVVNRDGDVSLKSAGNIALEAQGDITLQAQGNINLSAQQNVVVKGMAATLEGQSEAKVKGAAVSLAGLTQFSAS